MGLMWELKNCGRILAFLLEQVYLPFTDREAIRGNSLE